MQLSLEVLIGLKKYYTFSCKNSSLIPIYIIVVQGQMYTIPQNLAPNVNLSYCLDFMTLGSKLMKNKFKK